MRYANIAVVGLPRFVKDVYVYGVPDDMLSSVSSGCRVMVDYAGKKKTGVFMGFAEHDGSFPVKDILSVTDVSSFMTEELISLAEWMSSFYVSSLSETFRLMLPSVRSPGHPRKGAFDSVSDAVGFSPVTLSEGQNEALDTFVGLGRKPGFSFGYLWGVTGSGKTEVYLNLAKSIASDGGEVIYLVPEIALTVQLYRSFLRYFHKDEIAVVHSGISESARTKAFMDASEGKVKVILGTRSAVFAPFRKLALIVVDEEQDESYKSDNSPHFHARQVAWRRCVSNGALLLLGSATPSMESYRQISEGKCVLRRLDKRFSEVSMPVISEEDARISDSPLSDGLAKAMGEELDAGRQVMLFLNRRGFLYHYKCQSCGYEHMCPDCSVSMTFHKASGMFVCHRCGRRERAFAKCPRCGAPNGLYGGYGTEFAEEAVKRLFPFSKVLRMDRDTIGKAGVFEKTIEDFENGRADILVGTQMISKGFNFPSVSLVGILNAQAFSGSEDFRGDERLFCLLLQVAGRSGRFKNGGRVIIQSDGSCRRVIDAVRRGKIAAFYEEELEIRRKFGLPPFSRVARITVRSPEEHVAREMNHRVAAEFALAAKELSGKSRGIRTASIFSSGPCPIAREKGKYRMHTLVRSSSAELLSAALRRVSAAIVRNKSFDLDIDMDALNFL